MSALVPFWFIVIAVLWTGFFILEGFDFGVGMLLPILGRDETERRVLINTIGPDAASATTASTMSACSSRL